LRTAVLITTEVFRIWFNIGGYKLHIWCEGSGIPTVVMDTGLGGSMFDWGFVQPKVAIFHQQRLCRNANWSRDRARLCRRAASLLHNENTLFGEETALLDPGGDLLCRGTNWLCHKANRLCLKTSLLGGFAVDFQLCFAKSKSFHIKAGALHPPKQVRFSSLQVCFVASHVCFTTKQPCFLTAPLCVATKQV